MGGKANDSIRLLCLSFLGCWDLLCHHHLTHPFDKKIYHSWAGDMLLIPAQGQVDLSLSLAWPSELLNV